MTGLRPFVALLPIACLPVALATITGCTTPVVSPSALTLAQKRVAQEVGTPPKEGTLIIVDYTKPSSEKRMSVIDLKSGRGKMNSLVAHGVNSGLLYATTFSDKVGSEMSSLGLYKVSEEYQGRHGTSLKLDGLDPGFNVNARKRGIVVHSADYVSKETMRENRLEFGRIGRSQGCLALNEKDLVKLDHKLKRPAYVFAYAPTLLAQEVYPPAGSTPPVPAPPMPVLAKANAPVSATEEHPMVAATSPASRDLPAIPRPAAIQTGPVALARDTAGTGFYSVSDVDWRP